jgi:transcriptional regulator with XRE-family HTH domain
VASETLAILLKRLRELRRRHGLSQEAFAERAGMSYKYYQAVEAGRKPNLRLSTLEKLAAAYGLEVWQLLSPSVPKTTTLPIKRTRRAAK